MLKGGNQLVGQARAPPARRYDLIGRIRRCLMCFWARTVGWFAERGETADLSGNGAADLTHHG
jgi:hypothetical protein